MVFRNVSQQTGRSVAGPTQAQHCVNKEETRTCLTRGGPYTPDVSFMLQRWLEEPRSESPFANIGAVAKLEDIGGPQSETKGKANKTWSAVATV